jgi:hypothetical protein
MAVNDPVIREVGGTGTAELMSRKPESEKL